MEKPTAFGLQTDAFLDLIGNLLLYRYHLLNALPADILWRKEQLETLKLGDETKRIGDKEVFFRFGLILTRRDEPVTMGELSKALAVPLSTATRMVDKLVEHHYAQRVADAEDRRVVRITWTDEGREMFEAICDHWRSHIAQMMSRLEAKERDELLRLLRKAIQISNDVGDVTV